MTLSQVAGPPLPPPTAGGLQSTLPGQLPEQVQAILLAKKKQEWLNWVETEFLRIKNQRQAFERQWYINMSFNAGRQNIAPVNVPGVGFRLVAPKAPPWRVRMVINKIRTAVRTESSKLTSSKPIPVVIPATTEDEDYAAARVAEQILKSEFGNTDFEQTMRSFVWWGVITGNSFLKSYWAGDEIDEMSKPAPQEVPPQLAMQGVTPDMMPQPEPVRGKIKIERINPFHIYVPDLVEEELEKQPYIIHATTKSPLWVEQHFGFRPQADTSSSSTLMESAILTPVGSSNQGLDSVIIKEVWLKPGAHRDFPEGGIITVCGHRIIQAIQKWPLPFNEYPFYKYNGIPTGGFYTESVVTDLVPIQKEYNRTKSQILEIKNTMGKPKLMGYRGSFNPRQVSSEPGQAILVTPGYTLPTVLPAAEVPNTMLIELDRLASDFDDISGQHEITRGNTPAQVTSGTAISFLQEQDDSKLAYQVASIEHCIAKLGTHYLKYAATFWTDQRLVRIVGSNGDFEAKHWRGSDLRGNTDVRVQSGSALPVSKAARQALITDLMANGWIDPTVGLEVMELGGLDKLMEDFLTDKRAAQRENMRMAEAPVEQITQFVEPPVNPQTGQPEYFPDGQTVKDPATGGPWQPQSPMPVNSWDNHQAHIHFHNQYRKTQAFELLPEPLKKMFELHVQTHQMALSSVQMGQAGVVANPQNTDTQGQPMAEGGESLPPEAGGGPLPPPQ